MENIEFEILKCEVEGRIFLILLIYELLMEHVGDFLKFFINIFGDNLRFFITYFYYFDDDIIIILNLSRSCSIFVESSSTLPTTDKLVIASSIHSEEPIVTPQNPGVR